MKSKLLFLPLVLSLLCVFASCSSSAKKDDAGDMGSFVKSLLVEGKIIGYHADYSLFNVDSLADFDGKEYEGFVFFLNGDCSFCISQFFDFAIAMGEKNCQASIRVIVDEKMTPYVEYYLDQVEMFSEMDIHVLENTNQKYVNVRIDNYDLSGIIFMVKEGKIERCFYGNFADK